MVNSPIHDGVLGSDFNKGRGVIQGGKITPIDNKDDLLAMKPRGTIDNMISKDTNKTMKIESPPQAIHQWKYVPIQPLQYKYGLKLCH